MIKKIKSIANTEEKQRLLSNFVSLFVLQGLNYLLPLLTFPYLVRVLGVENFGLLAFATAIITYLGILTDYGFNLTATKDVAVHREDKKKLTEIFSSVMIIKTGLMLLSFWALIILVFSFKKFSLHWDIYLLTFGVVFGQTLFPVWFFQGMEKMKYITYLNIVSKFIFAVSIFVLVKDKGDVWIVPLLTSISFIAVGVCSLFMVKKLFGVGFKTQNIKTITLYLKSGWHVFVSRFYASMYTTMNTFLLGVLTNNVIVGYYAIAERITFAFVGLFDPANQAVYPYLAQKHKNSLKEFSIAIKKMATYFFTGAILLFIATEFLGDYLVYFINGETKPEVSLLLTVFLINIITFPFGSFFSNTLIILDKKKEFLRVMNLTVALHILLTPASIYLYGAIGLVCAYVVVVFIHVLLLRFYVNSTIKQNLYA